MATSPSSSLVRAIARRVTWPDGAVAYEIRPWGRIKFLASLSFATDQAHVTAWNRPKKGEVGPVDLRDEGDKRELASVPFAV